jgi:hypothetical protein
MKYLLLSLLLIISACGNLNQGKFVSQPPVTSGNPTCSVVQTDYGALISCPGADAVLTNGIQGLVGQTGATGLPGTSVTVVQLCPGTPSYPSTFPEVAFCISGNLYAVYSANDGFETLLTPGYYSSNAVGSSCNFTVAAGCQISY